MKGQPEPGIQPLQPRWAVQQQSQAIYKALKDAPKERTAVIETIRTWWDHPANKGVREVPTTVTENGAYTTALMASFDEWRPRAIRSAYKDHAAWKGLRIWAYAEAKEGRSIDSDVALALLDTEASKRGRGRQKGTKPAIYFRNIQIAIIINGLRRYTDFRSTPTTSNSPNDAYAITHGATGETFDTIRNAWNEHRKRLG